MKVINSKNTWYLIFGILFLIIITIIAFNTIFKRTENKLKDTSTSERKTLITQEDNKPSGITYTKASPTPSPKASKKPFFTLFDEPSKTSVSPSPKVSPSPTPSLTDQKETVTTIVTIDSEKTVGGTTTETNTTKGGLTATESSELKVINEDGTVYLSTQNDDGSEDTATRKFKGGILEMINPPKGFATEIGAYINRLLKFVMAIATLLVFGQLIIGGLQWITSGGDKGKVEEARNKITAAVIGLIIVASSYAILQLALNFLGFQSINELMNLL